MPNSWSKQACVKGFDNKFIYFQNSVNMFERMEIIESIHKGIVEPSYKKSIREDANRDGHISNKRGQSNSSQTHPTTGEIASKRRKRYVDCSKTKSKTCLIHGPRHFSYECKVLGYFGIKYANSKPNKEHENHPIPRICFNRQLVAAGM